MWKSIAPFIKNYEFRQEGEVRMVFDASIGGISKLFRYRHDKGVLKPYIDITREGGWPITEIMVGPGRNQDRVYKSICHFIEYANFRIPEVAHRDNAEMFVEAMLNYQVSQDIINGYKEKIEKAVQSSSLITYYDAIYDFVKEDVYLKRNYFSRSGIIVRKSNAPYEF